MKKGTAIGFIFVTLFLAGFISPVHAAVRFGINPEYTNYKCIFDRDILLFPGAECVATEIYLMGWIDDLSISAEELKRHPEYNITLKIEGPGAVKEHPWFMRRDIPIKDNHTITTRTTWLLYPDTSVRVPIHFYVLPVCGVYTITLQEITRNGVPVAISPDSSWVKHREVRVINATDTDLRKFCTGEVVEECKISDVEGSFQPTQGVWQDDYTFADKPGKQLTKVSDTEYRAELPMVLGRPTLLFGIRSSPNPNNDPERYTITIKGKSTGTKSVPVKFKFSKNGETFYETGVVDNVPLDSPCGEAQPFEVKLDAPRGIPPDRSTNPAVPNGESFTFESTGKYTLEAELVRENGSSTDIPKVVVTGAVVDIPVLKIAVKAAVVDLGDEKEEAIKILMRNYKPVRGEWRRRIPEYLPMKPSGVEVSLPNLKYRPPSGPFTGGTEYIVVDDHSYLIGGLPSLLLGIEGLPFTEEGFAGFTFIGGADVARTLVITTNNRRTILGGYHRTVVMLSKNDFNAIMPWKVRTQTEADSFAGSQKVILAHETTGASTIAHELAHTMPYLWSDRSIGKTCVINFHNKPDPVAHGIKITRRWEEGMWEGAEYDEKGERVGGKWVEGRWKEERSLFPATHSIMGNPETGTWDEWIDQCTYWHMLNQLQNPPDPDVIMVSGLLYHNETTTLGELLPAYQLTGTVDLQGGSGGEWAIILRDGIGAQLGRYPFEPLWTIEIHSPGEENVVSYERNLLSFVYRVPDLPGVVQIDLMGPGGLLDSLSYSANAPSVTITAPLNDSSVTPEDGNVRVEWTGTDADGDGLLYTVLYSPDGGETWLDQVFESNVTALDVNVDVNATSHTVKVIATDGVRSSEAVVRFSLATPATDESVLPGLVEGAILLLIAGAVVYYFLRRKRSR